MNQDKTTRGAPLNPPRPTPIPADGRSQPDARDAEIRRLRVALSTIALASRNCRGDQSYRDTVRHMEKTALAALGKRGIER